MSISQQSISLAQRLLPSPFTIAILITLCTLGLALGLTENPTPDRLHIVTLLEFWNSGFWELLSFAMQMTLMLILGHVLAISHPMQKGIGLLTGRISNTATAALLTALITLLMSFFNWGLGLIFGAIFARKVAEHCQQHHIPLNYPLIGAAGYAGLMVWHGGISGNAPLMVATPDHFLQAQIGIIGFDKTIFSTMNLVSSMLLLVGVPLLVWWLGKKAPATSLPLFSSTASTVADRPKGAEKLDASPWLGLVIGLVVLLLVAKEAISSTGFQFIHPNYINFMLLGLGLATHRRISLFLSACEEAVGGATGIIIQFPLYAGIMGIMKSSGLVVVFSDAMVQYASADTLPIISFMSAAIVNIFVPSGGGQWVIQGPVVMEACAQLQVPFEKGVMAVAYGDQLTNMLQPFWALPLLGITQLKAHQILPYSFLIMLVGLGVSSICLLFF